MGRSVKQTVGLENILGFDPIEYQQQQQKLLYSQLASAQSPYERIGLALGNIFGRAIGGEDPTLKRASEVTAIYNEAMQTFDPTTPQKAYILLADALRKKGYGPEATFALQEAAKYTKEEKSPFGQINPKDFTPESIKEFMSTGSRDYSILRESEGAKSAKIGLSGAPIKVGDITLPAGQAVFSQGDEQYILGPNKTRIPAAGIPLQGVGGTKVEVNLGDVLRQATAKAEGTDAGSLWVKAGTAYKDNAQLISTIDEFKAKAPAAFTGAGAEAQKNISKVFSAIGVPISEKASNTEQLQAFQSQFVQKIAKNFPGSQAVKELEQLIASQPNVKQELPTIIRLLDRFRDERLADQLTYKQLDKLPQKERYETNSNILTVENFNKIKKYRIYQDLARTRSPLPAGYSIEEAKRLQAELGLD